MPGLSMRLPLCNADSATTAAVVQVRKKGDAQRILLMNLVKVRRQRVASGTELRRRPTLHARVPRDARPFL